VTEGQVYHCQNRACGSEFVVTKASLEASANPRCSCGAEMKKPYNPPGFRLLDPDDELVSLFGASRKLTPQPAQNWRGKSMQGMVGFIFAQPLSWSVQDSSTVAFQEETPCK